MSFVKKEWKDRIVEFAGRRKLTNILTGSEEVVDVIRNEGNVAQEGDIFSADNMNDLETRVGDAIGEIEQAFQDGCDILVAECTTYGHTPSSNSPSDIAAAIGDIYEQGKADATPKLQAKNASFSTTEQIIKADSGYDGLSQVLIPAMEDMSGTSIEAASVTQDDSNIYFGVPKAAWYDEDSKIYAPNSNLGDLKKVLLGNVYLTEPSVKTYTYSYDVSEYDKNGTFTVDNFIMQCDAINGGNDNSSTNRTRWTINDPVYDAATKKVTFSITVNWTTGWTGNQLKFYLYYVG